MNLFSTFISVLKIKILMVTPLIAQINNYYFQIKIDDKTFTSLE